jgi:hypothetical protein
MFTLKVEKECGCFKKSDFQNNLQFQSKDDILIEAQKMTNYMNENFCQKHEFIFSENGQDFNIAVVEQPKASGGCCGGGHCSS